MSGLGGVGLERLAALEKWRKDVEGWRHTVGAKLATLTDRSTRAEQSAEAAQAAAGDAASVAADARSKASAALTGAADALVEVEEAAVLVAALTQRVEALEAVSHEPPVDPPDDEEPDPPDEPPPPPPPTDPGAFTWGDATHKIAPLINPRFDKNNPTLRDGQALTTTQRHYHDTTRHAFLRSDANTYTNWRVRLGSPDTYRLGRNGQVIVVPINRVLARTGDATLLDAQTAGWNLAHANLRVTWDAGMVNLAGTYIENDAGATIEGGKWVLRDGKAPWSPYPKWLYHGTAGTAGQGTDLNNLQTVKPWAILTEHLWTLWVNRGKASPAGFDYGAELEKWRPVIRDFIKTYSEDTSEPWADNYLGIDGGMIYGNKYRARAAEGTWPILVRGEGHAIYNSALLHYYLGLLGKHAGWSEVPDPDGAITAADDLMQYIRDLMVETVDSNGKPCLLFRSGSVERAMSATYTAYTAWEWAHIRDIGRWDHIFDDSTMVMLARSYADMIRPDGSTLDNIAAGVDRTGHGWDVSKGSDRTPYQNAINGFSAALLWEEGEYLFNTARAAQSTLGGYGDDAKAHILPAAQFLRLVGPLA